MNDPQSYPPVFRRRRQTSNGTIHVDEGGGGGGKPEEAAAVPVIDLERPDVGKLREAGRDWGFFRLVNHGVPEPLLEQLKTHAADFFAQPFDSKQALFSSGGDGTASYFWGTPILNSSGRTLDKSAQEINWVEAINLPLSSSQLPATCHHPSLQSFRTLVGEYGKHMGRISRTVADAMGKLASLECGDYVSEPTGIIRVYRYPQVPPQQPADGMQAHTDSSVVSIVLQDDQVSGLEFLKNDVWVPLEPVPNTLVVNIGDMMQAISDDEFRSVKHRVKVKKCKEDRISICYFVFPGEGQIMESSKYKPFTYREFQQQVQEDIKTLGFKVGLERFKRLPVDPPATKLAASLIN
ncbi:unnamed protein product [Linum tenue]|uniref:Fe2OG dioxygenase domain-containing protein n=1 Tax=Linum tenue TaxID=586396 RepID=A0AAV0IR60_9ROSI|nr:unnamed protein product [Linum tenue]